MERKFGSLLFATDGIEVSCLLQSIGVVDLRRFFLDPARLVFAEEPYSFLIDIWWIVLSVHQQKEQNGPFFEV